MYNKVFISLLSVLLLSTISLAAAQTDIKGDNFWVVYSPSATIDSVNYVSIGVGTFIYDHIGFTIYGANTKSDDYDSVLDYSCPHWDYRHYGELKGDTVGADILVSTNSNRKLIGYLGAGLYGYHYKIADMSNVTYWLYKCDDGNRISGAFTVGLQYRPAHLIIDLNYHSVRGSSFGLGWKF